MQEESGASEHPFEGEELSIDSQETTDDAAKQRGWKPRLGLKWMQDPIAGTEEAEKANSGKRKGEEGGRTLLGEGGTETSTAPLLPTAAVLLWCNPEVRPDACVVGA